MSYGPTEPRLVGGVHELLGEEAPGEEEMGHGELCGRSRPGAQAQLPPTERCQIRRGQVGHPCSVCPQVGSGTKMPDGNPANEQGTSQE